MVSLREIKRHEQYLNKIIQFHREFNINGCSCCDASWVKYAQIVDVLIDDEEKTYFIIAPVMKDRVTHSHLDMRVRYPFRKFLELGTLLDDSMTDILYADSI